MCPKFLYVDISPKLSPFIPPKKVSTCHKAYMPFVIYLFLSVLKLIGDFAMEHK